SPPISARRRRHARSAPRSDATRSPGSYRATACWAAAARSPAITGAWTESAPCLRWKRPERTLPKRLPLRHRRARQEDKSVGKNVRHRIKAGLPAVAPFRRRHRAGREHRTVLGDVAEHDALMRPGQDHLVLADHRAAAQACETDDAILARAGLAVAPAHRILGQRDAA